MPKVAGLASKTKLNLNVFKKWNITSKRNNVQQEAGCLFQPKSIIRIMFAHHLKSLQILKAAWLNQSTSASPSSEDKDVLV